MAIYLESQQIMRPPITQWLANYNLPVRPLALGAFMSSLAVKGHTKSWEPHERDHEFGENESTDIGKSQILRKEGNASINKVSAMRPGIARVIEKVRIARYFVSLDTDLQIAEDAWYIDYSDTWSWKHIHWLSESQSTNCRSTKYGCHDTVEFDTGVAWASLLITRIHLQVAYASKIQRLPATIYNTG